MLSLIISTIVFFPASYFIGRYMEESGIPKGFTRGVMVFALALAVSYGVAFLVDWIAG